MKARKTTCFVDTNRQCVTLSSFLELISLMLMFGKQLLTCFLMVFCSLLSNFTLQYMPIPLSDVTQAYRSAPERTEQALTKVRMLLFYFEDDTFFLDYST